LYKATGSVGGEGRGLFLSTIEVVVAGKGVVGRYMVAFMEFFATVFDFCPVPVLILV
jgi:hypothetical protein